MPTKHSWAAQIMALPPEKLDEETERVDKWIQQTMLEEFPESGQAERIVREMWPAVMEQEAIEAYLEAHPGRLSTLPNVDPWEASVIGGQEVMASKEEMQVAQKFLEEMLEGKRVPPLRNITKPLDGKMLAVDPISLYTYLGGVKAIKILKAGAKVAYSAVRSGYYEFNDWFDLMKQELGSGLNSIAGMSDEQIDGFIEMMWDYNITIDGETHKVSEWASKLSKEKLRM